MLSDSHMAGGLIPWLTYLSTPCDCLSMDLATQMDSGEIWYIVHSPSQTVGDNCTSESEGPALLVLLRNPGFKLIQANYELLGSILVANPAFCEMLYSTTVKKALIISMFTAGIGFKCASTYSGMVSSGWYGGFHLHLLCATPKLGCIGWRHRSPVQDMAKTCS